MEREEIIRRFENDEPLSPKEPCIICNAEARAALPDRAREITEEVLVHRPADCLMEIMCSPCWNCYGLGHTDYTQKELDAQIDKCRAEFNKTV